MSFQSAKDGLRKKDPGGKAKVSPPDTSGKTGKPSTPDDVTTCPCCSSPKKSAKMASQPATPGTPTVPCQPVIYSVRPETVRTVVAKHGRILTRADTIGAMPVPPPYSSDKTPDSVATTPGAGGGMGSFLRPPSGTTTKTDSTTADDPLLPSDDKEAVPMQAIPGMPYITGAEADFNTPRRWGTATEGDDERMLLNVGGVRHETHVSTLRAIPNSRLSRLAELHVQSGGGPQEYFFDRHPSVFNAIIDFYRTGELHVPLEVCGAVVKRELDFWQINEMEIKACCWRHYRSYIENQAILDSFNHSLEKENVHMDLDNLKGWEKFQWKVWLILEYPRTSRAAMLYGVTSFLFVVTSIAGFCLETLPGWRPVRLNANATNGTTCEENDDVTKENGKQQLATVMSTMESLYVLDVICTVFFTLELVLRFIFAPSKWRFVFSLMNIIDLLALVPLYVTVIFQSSSLQSCYLNERFVIEIMFILRIIRMFRIFHLVKHYQALKVLVYALKASLQELLMLFIFLLIGMLVFSTMIYYAERKDATNPGDMFSTIPMGFWWSIITMTTVGYGDVFPTSTIGYIVGTACSVCGVLMVALTIPVISNNFTLFYRHVRSRSIIPRSKGGEADSQIDIPETVRPTRKASLASNDGGPILNGHVSGMSHMFVPVAGFQQAISMNNIVLPKSDSDFNLIRSRSVKAHSDDGVTYRTEAFV